MFLQGNSGQTQLIANVISTLSADILASLHLTSHSGIKEWCYCAICGGPFEPTYFINDKSKEGFGYNPKVINRKKAAWITEVRLLLENIPGETGAYISGRGRFHYRGYIKLDYLDDDNWNITNSVEYACYKVNTGKEPLGAIPFHWPCFEILARNICTDVDDDPVKHVDLSRLYRVMFLLTEDGFSLDINTGAEGRRKGHWEYLTGEEYFIANPLPSAELTFQVGKIIWSMRFPKLLPLVDLSSRVINDPFRKLGDDIIYRICLNLIADDIPLLATAS
ncbi:hypothetical protein K445DRAFT_366260 [Daldinia sp. EC12]|nr:hypothetical protein K445DRAFT_366260 [Daldinia sp. EC12]